MKKLLIVSLTLISVVSFGQSKKKQDIEAIKSMCGCYEITFNFAETFAPDPDYEFHENYKSGGIEYVFPVEETKDKIALQHLLVIGDTMIIKHWRQDWIYENTDLYAYDQDLSWDFVQHSANEVKGQWTQKVYQVDDSPRYEGTGTWVHVDGRQYWVSVADAPLPRREFSKRSDYNVMKRRNNHEITSYGWLHEQDNDKIIRTAEGDQLLASEKGYNTYEKIDDSKCALAKEWWIENQSYWNDVRAVWDELFAKESRLTLQKKVDNKLLFQRLFALQDELLEGDNYNSETAKVKIRETIQPYVQSGQKLVSMK